MPADATNRGVEHPSYLGCEEAAKSILQDPEEENTSIKRKLSIELDRVAEDENEDKEIEQAYEVQDEEEMPDIAKEKGEDVLENIEQKIPFEINTEDDLMNALAGHTQQAAEQTQQAVGQTRTVAKNIFLREEKKRNGRKLFKVQAEDLFN